jgi:ribbon-helix-helix CopG family protein
MALPNDMQVVPVILFKQDVEHIDQLARGLRQSRSEFLRTLITDGLVAFSLPDRFSEEPEMPQEIQPVTA